MGIPRTVPYAILRTSKLKAWSNIVGSGRHTFREVDTPNADPSKVSENVSDKITDSRQLLTQIQQRLENVPVRRNSVLTMEFMITASPEWFLQGENETDQERDRRVSAYLDRGEQWLREKFGEENVICCHRHYDEKSPHLVAYVTPVVNGKLNAGYWLDGRVKLQRMQTEFHQACGEPFGLERGTPKSRARHTAVQEFYAKITSPSKDDPEVIIAKAKAYDLEMEKKKEYEANLEQMKAQSARLRQIPLATVFEKAGCERDPKDPEYQWKTPVGRFSINRENPMKFYNHGIGEDGDGGGKGGGGAIDLVMALYECDYTTALSWLANTLNERTVVEQLAYESAYKVRKAREQTSPPTGMTIHKPDPSTWDIVAQYLVKVRGLKKSIVESLKQAKKVWSDKFANAVFPLTREGKIVGLHIRGTKKGKFHGVRGEKSYFELKGTKPEAGLAVVESPIDAVSFQQLGFDGDVIATVGNPNQATREMIKKAEVSGRTVILAFDNDKAGDGMAKGLPGRRVRPKGKDWNQDLLGKQSGSGGGGDGTLEGM
jgi:hypothetical protein